MYGSLPSWERGLKFINGNSYVLWGTVAPFVGAWIEINGQYLRAYGDKSLPSWERGLKSEASSSDSPNRMSLPSWERGLKYCDASAILQEVSVAPFVGAWIEM